MSDNRKLVGEPDRERINVDEPYEVRHACAKYGCTEAELRHAVAKVGPMRHDIEKVLGWAPHAHHGGRRSATK